MTRRQRLCTRLAGILNGLLEKRSSWSADIEGAQGLDGTSVRWFLSAQRAGKSIALLETVTSGDDSARLVRYWLLSPDESSEGLWMLQTAEKNHEKLDEQWINDELEEAIGRLEDPQASSSILEIPKARISGEPVPVLSRGAFARRFREFAGLSFFVAGFVILAAFSSLQYHRMIRLVRDINQAIGLSSSRQSLALKSMEERLDTLDSEVEKLRTDVQREWGAFEFSRKHTAMNLHTQAEELPWSQYSRKRAYHYLADRIESAASYRDIIREISRLPEDNAQAETVLAVDRANIVPLSSYTTTIAGLSFPVRIDGKDADGADFMISSGFGELRPSDLHSGRYFPHMAVDIINVSNILVVTPGNSIVRFPGEPGSVVAAADGEVINQGFSSVYGWFLEVKHPLLPEWRTHYKGIQFLSTYYAHMAEDSGLRPGDRVTRSEKLGRIGSTGRSTGPHLHYEVRVYRNSGAFSGRSGHFDRVNIYIPKGS
ncbi:MAG: hypothetical protein CSA76_02550 [Spirochaetales bacterium]|nr:MAG: hypothetical protein CSA76_02550 [Spirochaetales bacterium]